MFESRKILLAVTGGIAAYKAANLVRSLKKNGAQVRVMMTQAAQEFVSPLTFATLSENKVYTDMFAQDHPVTTAHIEWAKWPDLIVIAPATANTIAKLAHGFADNVVTTTILAAKCPVLVCPAMNTGMYENKAYQKNEQLLCELGYDIASPSSGFLACGDIGSGRLVDERIILEHIRKLFTHADLNGKTILITAGPTVEAIDPVRFLSNHSSGKMGYALAEQAALRGATVDFVVGPNHLHMISGINVISVTNAKEMYNAVRERFEKADVFISAAAVADYTPVVTQTEKLKKTAGNITLEFKRTHDILKELAANKKEKIIVGFSLETENEIENALVKKHNKNCDLMIVNNPNHDGAGFQTDTNKVLIIDQNDQINELPLLLKEKVAEHILDKVALLMQK